MSDAIRWIVTERPDGNVLPEWMRSAGLGPDERVYIPGVICGSEFDAMLCASYDGEAIVMCEGHVYVPADWIASNYPDAVEVCEAITSRTREHFARQEAL